MDKWVTCWGLVALKELAESWIQLLTAAMQVENFRKLKNMIILIRKQSCSNNTGSES